MKQEEFLKLFKQHIFHKHGTQAAAAKHWGVSNNFISLVVNGVRVPNSQMLKDIKFEVTNHTTRKTVRIYKKVTTK